MASRKTKKDKNLKASIEKTQANITVPASTGALPTSETPREYKTHRLEKINVTYPTWCIFANQFIWGLDKTAYKCSECGLIVSRKWLALAKKTVCSSDFKVDVVENVGTETGKVVKNNVFTIHLPMGAKKSMILTPQLANEPLRVTVEKLCRQRAIPMEEYFAQDGNGKVVPLNTLLGKIGGEITFTKKDSGTGDQVDYSSIPPLIADLAAGVVRAKKTLPSPEQQTSPKDSPRDEPKVVERVPDVYRFEQELGNGAFSVVYQAKHKRTGDIVAIKVLDKYKEESRQQMKLKREIAIHQHLDHVNIIKFIQLDEDEDHFYVVMELVTGGELFDQICRQKYYYEKDAAPLLCQLLQGLVYLHDRGFSHRDIKPENLLFKTKDLQGLKIADFGESKSYVDGTLRTYCGTPDYMAPEIIKGVPYGPEVDLWAVGVTAFVMIGGYAPFEGENDSEVFAAILTLNYQYISPEWDHCGSLGKSFIDSFLKTDPKKRMTARQALQHPFITRFCSASECALPPPYNPNDAIAKLGELDKNSPKVSCCSAIDQTMTLIKADVSTSGTISPLDKELLSELAYMKQLVDLTSAVLQPNERTVLNLTWTRLKEMRDSRFP